MASRRAVFVTRHFYTDIALTWDMRIRITCLMFLRRLGQSATNQCEGGYYCPQILETEDNNFAAVGQLITEDARKAMPAGPGVGPTEGVVKIPRAVMIEAMLEIIKAA